jgi:hypothetical protein
VVLRPDTGASSYVAVDQDSCASEDLGDFGWNAGGAEVFAMTGGSQEPFRPCSVTYFGLDGRPHRTLDGARGEMAVIDTTTGAPVGRIGAGDKAPTPVGWTDTGHVLAVQRCGHDGGRLAVLDLAGHLTRTVTACGHPEGFPQLIRAAS